MPPSIRLAAEADAEAFAAIYAPVVRDTAISFELTPPTPDDFRRRIRDVTAFAPWLVLEEDGRVAGYAYASSFRARPAYRFTIETTVYVHADHRGRGVGRSLYRALLACLRLQGFRRAIGGITLPNAASVALHEASGFTRCAVFAKVGFKFGAWHDVGFWELELAPHVADPPELRAISELAATPEFRSALRVVTD
jgi:phosphinothricin acetyltransferase